MNRNLFNLEELEQSHEGLLENGGVFLSGFWMFFLFLWRRELLFYFIDKISKHASMITIIRFRITILILSYNLKEMFDLVLTKVLESDFFFTILKYHVKL